MGLTMLMEAVVLTLTVITAEHEGVATGCLTEVASLPPRHCLH